MIEQRRTRRQSSELQGTILLPGLQHPPICVVRDVTTGGALLELPPDIELPAQFDLLIGSGGLARPCSLAWRKGDRAGVAFG